MTIAIVKSEGFQGLQQRLKGAQSDTRVCHGSPAIPDYVNILAAARSSVLLSDWHVRLLDVLGSKCPQADDGPTLGLSLVAGNSAEKLSKFLNSLLVQRFPLSRLNIAAIDCGLTDETRALLETHLHDHGARYASFTVHDCFGSEPSQAHDHAIRQLSDSFVLISSAAVELLPDAISHALGAALADEDDVATWEMRHYPYEHPKYYDPVTLETPWSSHACILMRRTAYLQAGGYDIHLQYHGKDVELSNRLRGAGWKLRYLPQIPVTYDVEPAAPDREALQWARSTSIKVPLRYHFSLPGAASLRKVLLSQIRCTKRVLRHQESLAKAQEIVERDRAYPPQEMQPKRQAPFPFSPFDAGMSRHGEDVRINFDASRDNLPLVTVITRTRGPGIAILREAIASILNQTYSDIEHLIIEDRTDYARSLVAEVRREYGANIRYMKSDGPGRSAAGNLGLANATGELVMFLDNDDLVFSDHVELLARTLDVHPRLVGAYSLAWEVHTQADNQERYREVMHVLPGSQWLDFDRRRLARSNFIPIQALLFRRELFESAGGFRDDLDHLEDWNLWWRYAQHGDFMLVRKITSLYRTPAEPDIRARRQAELDKAYTRVKFLNDQTGT